MKVNHEHQKANLCGETSTMWLLSARRNVDTLRAKIAELNAFSLAEQRFNVRALALFQMPFNVFGNLLQLLWVKGKKGDTFVQTRCIQITLALG